MHFIVLQLPDDVSEVISPPLQVAGIVFTVDEHDPLVAGGVVVLVGGGVVVVLVGGGVVVLVVELPTHIGKLGLFL